MAASIARILLMILGGAVRAAPIVNRATGLVLRTMPTATRVAVNVANTAAKVARAAGPASTLAVPFSAPAATVAFAPMLQAALTAQVPRAPALNPPVLAPVSVPVTNVEKLFRKDTRYSNHLDPMDPHPFTNDVWGRINATRDIRIRDAGGQLPFMQPVMESPMYRTLLGKPSFNNPITTINPTGLSSLNPVYTAVKGNKMFVRGDLKKLTEMKSIYPDLKYVKSGTDSHGKVLYRMTIPPLYKVNKSTVIPRNTIGMGPVLINEPTTQALLIPALSSKQSKLIQLMRHPDNKSISLNRNRMILYYPKELFGSRPTNREILADAARYVNSQPRSAWMTLLGLKRFAKNHKMLLRAGGAVAAGGGLYGLGSTIAKVVEQIKEEQNAKLRNSVNTPSYPVSVANVPAGTIKKKRGSFEKIEKKREKPKGGYYFYDKPVGKSRGFYSNR